MILRNLSLYVVDQVRKRKGSVPLSVCACVRTRRIDHSSVYDHQIINDTHNMYARATVCTSWYISYTANYCNTEAPY